MSSLIIASGLDPLPFCYKASACQGPCVGIFREIHASGFRLGRGRGLVVRGVRARLERRAYSSRWDRKRISVAFSRDRGPTRGRRTRMLRPTLRPTASLNARCGPWLGLQLFQSRYQLVFFVFGRLGTGVEPSTLQITSSSVRVRVSCSLLFP